MPLFVSPLFFLESLWSFSLSCFSAPGDSGMSSSMASSDSQAWRGQRDTDQTQVSLGLFHSKGPFFPTKPRMDCSPAIFIYFFSGIEFSLWFELDKWSRGKMTLLTSHDFANERCLLTCVLMVSVRARYQSLMTLSISDWISSSVPWRVFSWGRKSPRYFLPKHHI